MTADQTQPVQFPDVNPSDLPPTSDFSMAAGDFLEVYQTPGNFVIQQGCLWKVVLRESGGLAYSYTVFEMQ